MSLAVLFHFLCAQHVSDINISIIRSLRLCCWITTSVVLFSVRCVLCWRFGAAGFEWCPCCRLHYSSTTTMMHGPINIRFCCLFVTSYFKKLLLKLLYVMPCSLAIIYEACAKTTCTIRTAFLWAVTWRIVILGYYPMSSGNIITIILPLLAA